MPCSVGVDFAGKMCCEWTHSGSYWVNGKRETRLAVRIEGRPFGFLQGSRVGPPAALRGRRVDVMGLTRAQGSMIFRAGFSVSRRDRARHFDWNCKPEVCSAAFRSCCRPSRSGSTILGAATREFCSRHHRARKFILHCCSISIVDNFASIVESPTHADRLAEGGSFATTFSEHVKLAGESGSPTQAIVHVIALLCDRQGSLAQNAPERAVSKLYPMARCSLRCPLRLLRSQSSTRRHSTAAGVP